MYKFNREEPLEHLNWYAFACGGAGTFLRLETYYSVWTVFWCGWTAVNCGEPSVLPPAFCSFSVNMNMGIFS